MFYKIYEYLSGKSTSNKELNIEFYTKLEKRIQEETNISDIINDALNSPSHLSLTDFFKKSNFKIDKFWDNIYENLPIELDDGIISLFEFKGSAIEQKTQLLKLLDKHKIPFQKMDRRECSEFKSEHTDNHSDANNNYDESSDHEYSSDLDSSSDSSETLSQNSQLDDNYYYLIMPDDFRKLLLCLDNKFGDRVQNYYIRAEHLVRAYIKYEHQYIKKIEYIKQDAEVAKQDAEAAKQDAEVAKQDAEAAKQDAKKTQIKLKKLTNKNQILQDTVEELTEDLNKIQLYKFILVRLYDNDPDTYDYYVVYGPTKKANVSYRRILTKFPLAECSILHKFNKDVKIYNVVKDKLASDIIHDGKYIAPKDTSTKGHLKFIKKIKAILDSSTII